MSEILKGENTGDISPEAKATAKPNYLNILNIGSGQWETKVLSKEEAGEILKGQRPEIFSQEDLANLAEIEKNAFSEELQEEPEDLAEEMAGGGNIFFLLRQQGQLVGYLYAKPAPKAKENFEEIGLPTDGFDAGENNLYIESIAGKMGIWGRRIYTILEKQAEKIGYKKISLHAINPRLVGPLTKIGFQIKRVHEDWLGHRAQYLEKEI